MALTKKDCDTIAKLFREHGRLTDLLHTDSNVSKSVIKAQRRNIEAAIRAYGIILIEFEGV